MLNVPGAQITEQIDDTHYKGTVKSKIGPAVMQFGGEVTVLTLDAERHSLQMLAKGADKADLEAMALANPNVQRILEGAAPRKVIVVPDRLVNIVA